VAIDSRNKPANWEKANERVTDERRNSMERMIAPETKIAERAAIVPRAPASPFSA
jgi:hypothetical protein